MGKQAVLYAREVPKGDQLYSEPAYLYPTEKWAKLREALREEADAICIAFPEVLGDNYFEIMANLSLLSTSGKQLLIAKSSPFIVNIGETAVPF